MFERHLDPRIFADCAFHCIDPPAVDPERLRRKNRGPRHTIDAPVSAWYLLDDAEDARLTAAPGRTVGSQNRLRQVTGHSVSPRLIHKPGHHAYMDPIAVLSQTMTADVILFLGRSSKYTHATDAAL